MAFWKSWLSFWLARYRCRQPARWGGRATDLHRRALADAVHRSKALACWRAYRQAAPGPCERRGWDYNAMPSHDGGMDCFVPRDDKAGGNNGPFRRRKAAVCSVVARPPSAPLLRGAQPTPSLRGAQRRGNPCLHPTAAWIASFLAMTGQGGDDRPRGQSRSLTKTAPISSLCRDGERP